ncbi:MAG: DNA-directed RNA polymerase subunit beta' [Parcubacteria group bacterium]|nr:DNA-directed RNA polymerase subunit beta' [Parcubacteria group bacterium]
MSNSTIQNIDFSAIRLKLASPDVIKEWSFGEVTKPETINYRTQRPEKDGLFCERIFGPSKDWECYCGKYKKIRYKGIVCDKCGVEVTRSIVRRERMGHIELSVPVSHIWYLRSVPSRLGLILDISVQNLEKVIYFANFIVTQVDESLKTATLEQIRVEYQSKKKAILGETAEAENRVGQIAKARNAELEELEELFKQAETELKELKVMQILSEETYHDLSLKYGHLFEAGIGAEAIRAILVKMDLAKEIETLENIIKKSKGAKKDKVIKRLRLLKTMLRNKIRPEWMILSDIPVIPPDLRPMVPLDGGRFATSDLNDLYRRVINRNNRLKQLVELKAPEVITRNEKRMLQEAVDALIDNSARHTKTVAASTGQKRMLKSLADMLKGKQGRFRQNLLGKRADYSGRSVIVVGPYLKLHQCGLPKKMALELFKPFIISQLITRGLVHNVRSGSRFIEAEKPEVWDILEELIKDAAVLLNRAPTLHRLGIQAFRPVLIEGKAIHIHPLVCAAFNADFDGDQMAVHVPLTQEAKDEAKNLMLSTKNILSPARGEPIASPAKDMVWGCYYMTAIPKEYDTEKPEVLSLDEAFAKYNLGLLPLRKKIKVKMSLDGGASYQYVDTSIGRVIFNRVIPPKLGFFNKVMDKKEINILVSSCIEECGMEVTIKLLDDIKDVGFEYISMSGWSWGMDDIPTLSEKPGILMDSEKRADSYWQQYEMGLLTENERYAKVVETWTEAKDKIVELSKKSMNPDGSAFTMVASGSRGSLSQLVQLVGMKGLVSNPAGEIIELPVKGNFKEGLDVLEYFISTHGARKGLADTALRTANSGYLTRRLVDVSQDVVVREEDCGTLEGIFITRQDCKEMGKSMPERIVGRVLCEDVIDPAAGEAAFKRGDLIDSSVAKRIDKFNIDKVKVRSVARCRSRKGICKMCYGWDLSSNSLVNIGAAVGIIAAQSIGEPGTQLTMRTFHTGGVAGVDITQGLPRVEEIFEVRTPKHPAVISEVEGIANIEEVDVETKKASKKEAPSSIKQKVIKIKYRDVEEDKYIYKTVARKKDKTSVSIKVREGDQVGAGHLLLIGADGKEVVATRGGMVSLGTNYVAVKASADKIKEYVVPVGYKVWVKTGDEVKQGQPLTEGSFDLLQFYQLKGIDEIQKYIIKEIQFIYSSQGQKLNDKHIEVIIKQLFSRVNVIDSGDTDLLPGDVVEIGEFERENERMKKAKLAQATGERLVLGVSRVALSTPSFLSAASFQETAKVLIQASLTGKVDRLEGLKENVIIGRLIPAGTGFKQ